jgi:hypothetical protein
MAASDGCERRRLTTAAIDGRAAGHPPQLSLVHIPVLFLLFLLLLLFLFLPLRPACRPKERA